MCSHCSAVAFSFRVLIQGGSGGIGTFAVQVTDGPLHLEMTSDMSEKLITHNKAFLTALVHQWKLKLPFCRSNSQNINTSECFFCTSFLLCLSVSLLSLSLTLCLYVSRSLSLSPRLPLSFVETRAQIGRGIIRESGKQWLLFILLIADYLSSFFLSLFLFLYMYCAEGLLCFYASAAHIVWQGKG